MKRIPSFLYLIISFGLMSMSCQDVVKKAQKIEKFNEKMPYALKIGQERSYFQAYKVVQRINDLGIHSYIIKYSDTLGKSGEWFQVMCGAIAKEDSVKKYRDFLSTTFHLKNTEIVRYANYKSAQLEINTKELKEVQLIGGKKPDLDQKIFDIIKIFPKDNSLYISNLSIANSPDNSKDRTGLNSIYQLKLDLPRGISRKNLLETTSCFAEVIYRDNLYGEKIIIDIGKLKNLGASAQYASFLSLPNKQQSEIANEFADLILNTGEYPTEEKMPIEIQARTKLKGYKVTISLWNNQLRTYLVLVDEQMQYIIFSQSNEKSEAELEDILKEIGKGNGLIGHGEFYNSFFTIPSQLPENNEFTAFSLNRLEKQYATDKSNAHWAKEMVGHWQATAYFKDKRKGNWSYSLFDLLTDDRQNYIYKTLYWKNKSKNKQVVNVCETKGMLVTSSKFNWKKFKTIHQTLEINFGLGRYICAIDNSEKSWLSRRDMVKIAESLQLNQTRDKERPVL